MTIRKASVLLLVLVSALFLFSGSALAQNTVIRPNYQQFKDTGHPTHPVLIRNVSSYELEVRVKWPEMKTEFVYTLDPNNATLTSFPSYVSLDVRARAWVYNKKGKKEPKEMVVEWYYEETLGATVFWFPRLK